MKNKIKLILLACGPRRNRERKCRVSVLNAENRFHTTQLINKCRETQKDIGGSCKPIIAYNIKTRIPVRV